jgi:hypothetical protein
MQPLYGFLDCGTQPADIMGAYCRKVVEFNTEPNVADVIHTGTRAWLQHATYCDRISEML